MYVYIYIYVYISNCLTASPATVLGLGGGDTYRAVVEELDTSPPKLAGGGNPQTPTFQKARTQKLQLFESPEPRNSRTQKFQLFESPPPSRTPFKKGFFAFAGGTW